MLFLFTFWKTKKYLNHYIYDRDTIFIHINQSMKKTIILNITNYAKENKPTEISSCCNPINDKKPYYK